MNKPDSPILVLAATGETGCRAAERPAARGVPVRAGSRSAQPAFAWDRSGTWPAALSGTRTVHTACQPDPALRRHGATRARVRGK